ncbi:MAG: hypothetical protein LUO98_01615 [Methanoregula sp.]|nr:hypothetical protein [Methanoregula sp.]
MRTLQPNNQEQDASLCSPCVYYSKNLDPSFTPSAETAQHACGLEFDPGDDNCIEMRTNNCGRRKKKDSSQLIP